MTLFEVGLFYNSVLVYSESFYPLEIRKSQSIRERSHLINLISKMAERIYETTASSLEIDDYRMWFLSAEHQKDDENVQPFFIYCIGDSSSDPKIIKGILKTIHREMIAEIHNKKLFKNRLNGIDESEKKIISNLIHSIIADERFKPVDRVINFIF